MTPETLFFMLADLLVCPPSWKLRVYQSPVVDALEISLFHGSPAAVDVTLTCPLQYTLVNRAVEELGYTCKLAEERKLPASVELCQQSGFEFIPLALETSGGFGTSATSFLTVLAERCADKNLRDRAAEKLQFSNASTWPCTGRTQTWFCQECRPETLNLLTCVSAERSHLLQPVSVYATISVSRVLLRKHLSASSR